MDILEIEDVLKGLPDQSLMQEAKQPTGQVPQYMVVSEIQRRSKMRKSFEAQKEQPSSTITEQILTGGVASVAPPPPQMMGAMGMPQQPPAPPQQPPMGQQQPPMQPQQMPPQQPPMPQQGAPMPPPVQMQGGGQTPYSNPQGLIVQALEEGVPGSILIQQAPQFADLINRLEAQMLTKMGVDQYEDIKQDYIPYGREFDSDLASAPAGPVEEVVVTADRLPPLEPQGQITSRALPQSSAVGLAAPTIDTGAENLLFDQPLVAEGFEKRTPEQEAIARFMAPDPTGELSGTKRRRARETTKGITFRELFPGRPSTGGQMGRMRREENPVPEDPFGMLRSDTVGFEPLRSQQNILQETISDMALVGDQPVVTNVASSSAVKNDAQTGANASGSTGTEITEKELVAGLSDVTPEAKVQQDIVKNFADVAAPSFASLISEQERRLAKIREDSKRDIGAQALINLGAGVAEGDVSGGLVRAGQAVSKIRAGERAAESEIANMQTRIKMAEEQGKFDVAKALRAEQVQLYRDATKAASGESQFVRTLGLSTQKLLAEIEKEAGVDARAKLAAAISIMEEELNPDKKQRLIDKIASTYLPLLSGGAVANSQSGLKGNTQNRPPISSFGG